MNNDLNFIEIEAEKLSDRKCFAGILNNFIAVGDSETGKIIGHAFYENDSYKTLTIYIATHKLNRIIGGAKWQKKTILY